MVINSSKEIGSLVTDLQNYLGEHFTKREINKLSKFIKGRGRVDVYKIFNVNVRSSDALYIRDVMFDYADTFKSEVDSEYEILVGENWVPGYYGSIKRIRNGKLDYSKFNVIGALFKPSKTIVFKRKELKVSNNLTSRNIVYAVIS